MARPVWFAAPVALLFTFGASAQESAVATIPPAAPASAAPVPAVVHLKDGQELHGKLVGQDATGATLELEGGARVLVPQASIGRLEVGRPGEARVWAGDPNRTRYLYSPSGFMLRQGEGYISQTELILTSVAYGVTDHLTVGLGSSIPFLFVDEGVNVVGSVKAGGSVGEYVHLAGIAQALWLPQLEAGTTIGLLLGAVTVGTPNAHLGVAAGPPFVAGERLNELGDVVVSISGNLRVWDRLALVSENWILPGANDAYALSGALRFIGQRLGVDAGLVFIDGASVPIPWLDFTFNFGAR